MNDPGPLPFERLEFIDDPVPRAAALNMALDEILLDGLGELPLLRVYRWERPAMSIGCFEQVEPVRQRWTERDVVRRWTGGGVVEHGHDLTFSLLVPRPLRLATLMAAQAYRFIHSAVAVALRRAGQPDITLQAEDTVFAASSRECFGHPVPYDLLVAGRKIAGGAQRRTRRGLLHQGSVQIARDGRPASVFAGLPALGKELALAFGTTVEKRFQTTPELHRAAILVEAKYGARTWLERF